MPEPGDRIRSAHTRLARYCALGERSAWQVATKLDKLGLSPDETNQVIRLLKINGFLDETRFARAFAHDKLKFNNWGRKKISLELSRHQIDPSLIEQTLENLDRELYQERLNHILMLKLRLLSGTQDIRIKKKKLIDYAVRKGFETDLVYASVQNLLTEAGRS